MTRLPLALALIVLSLAAGLPAAGAELAGGVFEISGAHCRFPDAAWGSPGGGYLVVWADYGETRVHGRRLSGDGRVEGDPFRITEAPFGGLFPAVACDEERGDFLVTWDDFGGRGETIHGQRVRGSDGALLGANFPIGSMAGGIRSAVAWSRASRIFLVLYWVPGAAAEVYGQRVSADGALLGANFNVSRDAAFSGYPAVAWGESGNQFLVSWDNEDGNIHGRRVDAATGMLLGQPIVVSAGGAKDRSCIAYDPAERRWLVQHNDGANPGHSYDQTGRLVSDAGALLGAPIPLAHTPAFEGDTQFGGDVAFAPRARRYFSSFGTDTGMGGQESDASGAPVGPQLVLGTGFYTSLSNTVDSQRNRFLTVWEGLEAGTYRVYGRLVAATLGAPTDFAAAAGASAVTLSWRNPADPHFAATVVRVRTDRHPEGPGDGEPVVDQPGLPGSSGGFVHQGLTGWTTYYYSAFARDEGPNHSPAARAAATPRPSTVTIEESDFATGPDGWTLAPWRAGTLSPGTVAWDPAAQDIVCRGSGTTNNRDPCTREGGIFTRAFSTAGRRGIQVEYDVMASLHAPPPASGAGGCPIPEGQHEDRLIVSWSASGASGPWMAAESLVEGSELPCGWTRRLINLAGLPAADDNPSFALRFQWVFNHESDSGRVDAIRVLTGAVTGPSPSIRLSTEGIERSIEWGQAPPPDSFTVANPGEGVLEFQASADVPWLQVSPAAASSAGPPRRMAVSFDASGLEIGEHRGSIEVSAAGLAPQALPVLLRVLPRSCLREPFAYYDGALSVMGGASWTGNAANDLAVEEGALRVQGGAGALSASRTAACASASGIHEVRLRIRGAPGTGDFFWNLAIDDEAGANLARWYGGSVILRGRVGSSVTADLPLSGPGAWDDLLVRIDTAANESEYFFNGVSAGTISHGGDTGARIGAIRIERLDRAGVASDSILLDDLVVESAPAPAFHRADPDSSGKTDLADALFLLAFLYRGGAPPDCAESADASNDGRIDVADAVAILLHLFGGRSVPAPGPPGAPCGPDVDPPGSAGDLGCARYPCP